MAEMGYLNDSITFNATINLFLLVEEKNGVPVFILNRTYISYFDPPALLLVH